MARGAWQAECAERAFHASGSSAEGSGFDTLLGVYTGTAVDCLTARAADDQSGAGDTSLLAFTTAAHTTYYIAVDGYRDFL